MVKIEEYILLSKEVRQKHLKLTEPCVERGCQSYHLKGLLAYILDTSVPSGRNTVQVCHACHNGKCAHPYHIYWGTPTENRADATASGVNSKTLWQRTVDKHGEEKAREFLKKRTPRRIANIAHLRTVPRKTKIVWPEITELVALVKLSSCSKVARDLGVSANAVGTRLEKFGFFLKWSFKQQQWTE